MAKLNAAHMSILCILVGASYFACDCAACEEHVNGTSRDEEAAECSEAEISEGDSDQEEADAVSETAVGGTEEPAEDVQSTDSFKDTDDEGSTPTAESERQATEEPEEDEQSTVNFKDTDDEGSTPTSEPALRGNEEPEEDVQSTAKFNDTDEEVPTTVQPAVVHHDSSRGAVPALKDTENFYRHALRLVAKRAHVNDDADSQAIELVHSLVRLVFAVKAIRTYIHNVRAAWTHLKDTVHHLAEHEEQSREERESEGDASLRL